MRKKFIFPFIFLTVIFLILVLAIFFSENRMRIKGIGVEGESVFLKKDVSENSAEIAFVGDIMLDRWVEKLMEKKGYDYPFLKIKNFLKKIDFVFGNLEGPIVKNPPDFPEKSLKFAFSPKVLPSLSLFNLFSLANNHTLNMGEEGLKETRNFLKSSGINFVGDPVSCDFSLSFFKSKTFSFLAFNRRSPSKCSDEEVLAVIEKVKKKYKNTFLILYFHWGNEYQKKSSFSQRRLAKKAINAGADLIIGSHPHVVQEIEKYKGKLIFYSLGNFIFDQYFSQATQEGLIVKLEMKKDKLIFSLFPFKSVLSQPDLMKEKEKREFLKNLSKKSSADLKKEIEEGRIIIKRIQ